MHLGEAAITSLKLHAFKVLLCISNALGVDIDSFKDRREL